MAYPKHTLFYSAVLDQVQTCSVDSHIVELDTTLQFIETHFLHLPRTGIKLNLNNPKAKEAKL